MKTSEAAKRLASIAGWTLEEVRKLEREVDVHETGPSVNPDRQRGRERLLAIHARLVKALELLEPIRSRRSG